MMRHSHLSDDQLAEVCLHSAPAGAERQHLEGCGLCEARCASRPPRADRRIGASDVSWSLLFQKSPESSDRAKQVHANRRFAEPQRLAHRASTQPGDLAQCKHCTLA